MHDQAEQWTVLAVDDEPQILNAVEDLLEDHFTVYTAESAERALEVLAEHRISVIISDQRMPGMSGDEFLSRARKHSAAARILLTGYADFSAVVRAVNEGQIYAYLAKPWDPEQLRLTVRRAAEHAALLDELGEERRLLRLLMDNVPDEIFFKDTELRYLRANKVTAARLGIADPKALAGCTIGDFVDAKTAAEVEAEERAILDGSLDVLDTVRALPQAADEGRWFSVTKVPMVNEQGAAAGLIGIARDVHERYIAEEQLRESEERFRDFADTASDWFWEMDADLRFTSLSESIERTLRHAPSELLGKRRGESGYVEADGHLMAKHLADLEAHRPFRDFVYGRPLPDGSVAWAATSGKPRFDATGRFLGYRGTGRDVSAEREARASLADSERRVRLLLDSAAEGIYGVDVQGHCTFINPAALEALGYERAEELLGRSLHGLTHHTREDGTPYPREECRFAATMGSGNVIESGEELLWRADGSSFYAQMAMHPVVVDGEVSGAVVSFTDVTERRRSHSAVMLVNRIAVALGQTAGMEAAMETTLRLICDDAHWQLGEAWVPDSEGRRLSIAAVSHGPDPALEQFVLASEFISFRRGQGLPGRVWESCQPLWLPDPGKMPASVYERNVQIRPTGLHGACAIPVQADGEVVAVLVFYSCSVSEEDNLRIEALTAAVAPLAAFLKRITMEDAVREADRRLNLALESAKVGTWDWTFASGELRWDAFMPPLFGVAADAVPTDFEAFNELVHPADREPLGATIRVAVDEHRDLATEFRIVRPDDGRVRVIAARGRVSAENDDGAPLRMTGVNWDVTEERNAQAEVANLARFYLENPQPVLRIAADGQVLLSNAASAALRESWIRDGQTSAPPEIMAVLPRILDSGDATTCELNVGERVLQLSLVPVPRQAYVNVYGEDITVQRETAERMRQAQKMEAVGQLTGGIAHDFNNRLTVVSGNLELIELQLPEDSPCVKLVGHARRATDGAAKLTRQLLTFARRQLEEPETVDVNQHIEALQEMIGRSLGETVALELNLCASPWAVFTDAGQLEDALLNLCVNARDAMPDGGRVCIESENVSLELKDIVNRPYLQAGDYVMIAVSDNGCGMPREVLDRIFEPFFTTKAVGKGTGLGLSMVYGFTKQSGGHLHAYSEVGHGTCFKIYLPRQERREEARPNDGRAPAAAAGGQGRILVVEDDDGVREVAATMLTTLGYTVAVAENGPTALALLEGDAAFDLLFTDMVMPGGMTGFDLAREVSKRWPGMRLLFTSGYTDQGPFKDANEQPNVNWVLKPYTHAKLASRVGEVLAADADQAHVVPALPTFEQITDAGRQGTMK